MADGVKGVFRLNQSQTICKPGSWGRGVAPMTLTQGYLGLLTYSYMSLRFLGCHIRRRNSILNFPQYYICLSFIFLFSLVIFLIPVEILS